MALRSLGVGCLFATNAQPHVLERVSGAGFDVQPLDLDGARRWDTGDVQRTVAVGNAHGCAAIIVDSNRDDEAYLAGLREAGFFVCAVDDTARHPFPCQMVVNGDIHAERLPYRSLSGDTVFLLGTRYSILRPEFWNPPIPRLRDPIEQILVTFGGADPLRLTPLVIRLLDRLPEAFRITAVAGPFFKDVDDVLLAADQVARPVDVVPSPGGLFDLILKADLAITGGGQTLYELASIGCPAVAVQIVPDQAEQVRAFAEAGLVQVAGNGGDAGLPSTLAAAVSSLLADRSRRMGMSKGARQAVDGRGAPRVAQAVGQAVGLLRGRAADRSATLSNPL